MNRAEKKVMYFNYLMNNHFVEKLKRNEGTCLETIQGKDYALFLLRFCI